MTGPRPAKSSRDAHHCPCCDYVSSLAAVIAGAGTAADMLPDIEQEDLSMPMLLKGSCRCGAVGFEVESHTPAPFMLCYCSICRKQQGGGGYAINLGARFRDAEDQGQAPARRLPRRDRGRRAAALRGVDRRAQLLQEMRLGAVALRSDLAGTGAPLRLGDRQRTAEAEGARPHHAEIQGVMGRARYPQGRQDVRALSGGIDRRLAQADEDVGEV